MLINKKSLLFISIITLLALILIIIIVKTNNNTVVYTPPISPVVIKNSTSTPVKKVSPTKTTVKTVSLDYGSAKTMYEGHRIQFNDCLATPNKMTVKNGTKIMLDGRSATGNKVSMGGVTYNLENYQFKIATITAKQLPAILTVNCTNASGPHYNIASISVAQ
ncbi:MAG: hypothetical protein C3F02_04965 [Parcubacteria group bacterium]|nr:MAG: hypothetical protein C3F02_04965 [Parcubacteria group bacterium]